VAEPAETLPARAARGQRTNRAAPTAIHDLFMARLEEIERRVSSELARPAEASGPLQELLLDTAREVWAHARSMAVAASRPGGLSAFVTEFLAAGATDDLGVDERLLEPVRHHEHRGEDEHHERHAEHGCTATPGEPAG